MTLKEKITSIKNWYEVRDLQYPEHVTSGVWYLYTVVSTGWDKEDVIKEWKKKNEGEPPANLTYHSLKGPDYVLGQKHYQVGHYSHVFICIKQYGGSTASINLGCVDLARKDFPEKWKELVSAAKDRVDRLNSVDAALGTCGPTQCAECNNNALEGDYLCGACRG